MQYSIPGPRPQLSRGGLLSQLHRAFAGCVPHQAPDSTRRLVTVGIWAYMTLYTTGMCWWLWSVMPEPLPTYNRFQNFLYRRRAGVKPWLHRTGIAIFAINLAIGITIRFAHGHHGHLTGQANVNSWVIIGSAVLILVMKLWPLPAKAER
jgi:hypothetical protein